jgi:uncharacterized repeat protein (TIGR01451 family)
MRRQTRCQRAPRGPLKHPEPVYDLTAARGELVTELGSDVHALYFSRDFEQVARDLDPVVVALHALSFITDLHAPVLATTKTVRNVSNPGQPPAPNDVLEYQVDVSNSGNDGAADLHVTDPLPAGTTFVPGSISSPGRFDTATNSVILNLGQGATSTAGGSLDADGGAVTTATATFRVKVGADVQDGAPLHNVATFDFLTATSRPSPASKP